MPDPDTPIPCLVGDRSLYPDPFTRGLAYLQQVQKLALDPNLIHEMERREHIALCTWIGLHIDIVNTELNVCLKACQACFHEWERRSVRIFAAPFCQSYGIDGLCNLHTTPSTILIDVGRVVPQDWLGLVAHEYAHVHVGSPGHEYPFLQAISHLCLGLGLVSPQPQSYDHLRHWPPSRRTSDPTAFWLGHR